MSGVTLVLSYVAFALIAAAANIGSQWLCLREYGGPLAKSVFDTLSQDGWPRFVGAAIGLAIGYVTKYHLDRRFVFRGAM